MKYHSVANTKEYSIYSNFLSSDYKCHNSLNLVKQNSVLVSIVNMYIPIFIFIYFFLYSMV